MNALSPNTQQYNIHTPQLSKQGVTLRPGEISEGLGGIGKYRKKQAHFDQKGVYSTALGATAINMEGGLDLSESQDLSGSFEIAGA